MERLTTQEEQALKAVYKVGEGNVKLILSRMEEGVAYTTLASTIRNLEKKGYLSSRMVANTYLYKPVFDEGEFKQRYMGEVVKDYFGNSYKGLVNFFVEQKKLSAKELQEILTLIEKGNTKGDK
ncbi:MAG: BlaI/MecI/CopY family transcriptional regulator [Chitinophagaceae bacterium]|nr:MAG: BlaI/MecI/CopY family transcriptional regulator [Chitinophagaceae bacterium]